MTTPLTTAREWRLFAAWVAGDSERARVELRAASELSARAFREMLLMLHLFAGVPRTLEACATVEGERPDFLPPPDGEVLEEPDCPERGWRGFEAVYAAKAPAVLARLKSFHGDIAHWVIGHAYGRVLGRPGLSFVDRELLAVAALVELGTVLQLESHVRGALRTGADLETVRAVVEALADQVDGERMQRARACVDAVSDRDTTMGS